MYIYIYIYVYVSPVFLRYSADNEIIITLYRFVSEPRLYFVSDVLPAAVSKDYTFGREA